jgi:hypothetical protein
LNDAIGRAGGVVFNAIVLLDIESNAKGEAVPSLGLRPHGRADDRLGG